MSNWGNHTLVVTTLCVLCELYDRGLETVFISEMDCVHCEVWAEAEETVIQWLKYLVEIELYEQKNDVQIVGSSGMMLRIIICPREVTQWYFSRMVGKSRVMQLVMKLTD